MLTDKLRVFADNKVMFSHSNKMLTRPQYNIADQFFNMKKIVTIFFKYRLQFFILSALIQISCEKTQIQFGQAYVDNTFSNLVLVDTLSTQLSTVYTDSVPTSGSGVVLVGNYDDDAFGKITAKSFFEVVPPAICRLSY